SARTLICATTPSPNGDLGKPGGRAVFALSLDDGTHGLQHLAKVTTFVVNHAKNRRELQHMRQ
ncbi:MAG: hypothetical protein WAU16_16150, partial [Rhizobiaceae bacterium]